MLSADDLAANQHRALRRREEKVKGGTVARCTVYFARYTSTNMRPSHRIPTTLLAAGVLLAACDSSPAGPRGPGALQATLVSPNGIEGAAVLELTGPGLGQVTVEEGLVFSQANGDITRVVVVLDDAGPVQFKLRVEDVSALPAVTLIEVADGDNQLRNSLSGYRVEFVPIVDTIATLQARTP